MGRFLSTDQLVTELKKSRSKPLVFTNGCFDILHVGHIRYLTEARTLGGILVVGLNADASVKGLKGEGRPVQNEADRGEILAALSCVDYVTLFSESTPYELIKKIQPEILVKGGDWPVDKIIGADLVLARGGKVLALPFHKGRSSSDIISRILSLG